VFFVFLLLKGGAEIEREGHSKARAPKGNGTPLCGPLRAGPRGAPCELMARARMRRTGDERVAVSLALPRADAGGPSRWMCALNLLGLALASGRCVVTLRSGAVT
jgi:hypothetical protein